MINTLNKFKTSFNKLSSKEKEELNSIHKQSKKYLSKQQFDDAISFLKSKLEEYQNICGKVFIENIKHEIVKAYNEYIIFLINKPIKDNKNTQKIKVLFNECDNYIGTNIKSYLLKQNNYACFLSQNGHAKQAIKLQSKLQKIDIIEFLNENNENTDNKKSDKNADNKSENDAEKYNEKKESSLSIIAKDFSNLSSLNNSLKNSYDALGFAMESLALTQFDNAFCIGGKDKNSVTNVKRNLCFGYYTLGVHQEYLKRNKDSISSFSMAKLYIPQSNSQGKNEEFNFIKKIHLPKNDKKTSMINFRESLNLNGINQNA